MVSSWFTDEFGCWWWCAACDVYSTERICWSCHTPDTSHPARNPLGTSSYQVHTDSRREACVAGHYVTFVPADTFLEGAA